MYFTRIQPYIYTGIQLYSVYTVQGFNYMYTLNRDATVFTMIHPLYRETTVRVYTGIQLYCTAVYTQ